MTAIEVLRAARERVLNKQRSSDCGMGPWCPFCQIAEITSKLPSVSVLDMIDNVFAEAEFVATGVDRVVADDQVLIEAREMLKKVLTGNEPALSRKESLAAFASAINHDVNTL